MASTIEHRALEPTQTAHKRRVNELIFESLGSYMDGEIAFFCECPSEQCFDTVWMSVDEYQRGRLNPRWSVIRAGHERPRMRQAVLA